jgi:hypothetical protein
LKLPLPISIITCLVALIFLFAHFREARSALADCGNPVSPDDFLVVRQ